MEVYYTSVSFPSKKTGGGGVIKTWIHHVRYKIVCFNSKIFLYLIRSPKLIEFDLGLYNHSLSTYIETKDDYPKLKGKIPLNLLDPFYYYVPPKSQTYPVFFPRCFYFLNRSKFGYVAVEKNILFR